MKIIPNKAISRYAAAAILLACAVCLGACIDTRDDRSECTVDMTFRFEYTLNKDSDDLFGRQAECVDLYIYNGKGSFVTTVRASRAAGTLGNDNKVVVNLMQGNYTAVVWANMHNGDFECTYDGPISQHRVNVIADNNNVPAVPSAVMHGTAAFTANNTTSETGEVLVSMTKNTNNVKIILNAKGNPAPVPADAFIMSVTGSNGAYKSDNSFAECARLNYIPQYSKPQANSVQGEFNVLRLRQGDDLCLTIDHNNTRSEVRLPMTDMLTGAILQHPMYTNNSDLDRYDEYVLEYDVDMSGSGAAVIVLIKINDWTVVDWGGPIGR